MTRARLQVAVVGAGLAGLVAARELRRRGISVRVYEAGRQVAGLARSFTDPDGFTHDFGAHFITNRLAAALGVGAECTDVHRYGECVRLDGRVYSYPVGLMRSPRFVAGALRTRLSAERRAPALNAAEWYRREYGPALAEEVAIPLVEAWSGVPATELAPSVIPPQVDRGTAHVLRLRLGSWLSGRAVANGYSREKPESVHVWHVYPKGSLAMLCDRLSAGLEDCIALESPVEAILVEDGRARGVRVRGEDQEADVVISTAPVHILGKLVQGTEALRHLTHFRYRPMTLVNMKFEGTRLLPDVVTWVPERRHPFFRLTEVTGAIPWLAPEGRSMLSADIGCEVGDEIWRMPEDRLGQHCLEHLEELFPGLRRRYLGCSVLRTPIAHPVFLNQYEAARVAWDRGTGIPGLYSVGRNGEFAHILMEDVYWRTLARMREVAGFLHAGSVSPPRRVPEMAG